MPKRLNDLTLREVTQENWRQAMALSVHPDQRRFVAEYEPVVAVALAKAYLRLGGATWTPYAVYEGDVMVGFVALAEWPDGPDTCWIFHFFIDRGYQGRGRGRSALESLVDLVRREHAACRALALVVHPDNERARRLYAGAGFRPTGELRWGEPVFELPLRGS